MTIPNPEHLLGQAELLSDAPPAGAPRQVNLRRAMSASYYAVFHAILTAAADEFVGRNQRTTLRYSLVYRSVDHRSLRELCSEAAKVRLSPKYARYVRSGHFGPNLRAFGVAAIELYEYRHAADYDPAFRAKKSDAKQAILTARNALKRLEKTPGTQLKEFLSLLLFRPR